MIFSHCGGKRGLHATKRTASPKLTLLMDHLMRAGLSAEDRASHSRWLRTARRTSGILIREQSGELGRRRLAAVA